MEKNLSIIGVGKLGLCLSLNLEKSGFNIIAVDKSSDYIMSLENKSFISDEDGVTGLLLNSKQITFSTNILDALVNNIIFLVVATPSLENGDYDHQQIDELINYFITLGFNEVPKHLVICCTTMPGYTDTIISRLSNLNWFVSYNPEFIAQGTILKDQTNPDLILIGQTIDKYSQDLININYICGVIYIEQ
jgi:UDP-glucose 6-dehydrogenase